jgi:hypothetical protein
MISIPTSIAGDDDVGSDGNALGDLSQTGVTSNLVSIGIGPTQFKVAMGYA